MNGEGEWVGGEIEDEELLDEEESDGDEDEDLVLRLHHRAGHTPLQLLPAWTTPHTHFCVIKRPLIPVLLQSHLRLLRLLAALNHHGLPPALGVRGTVLQCPVNRAIKLFLLWFLRGVVLLESVLRARCRFLGGA